MDWQIRVALVVFGIALVGYIYYDYSKRKKTQIENEKLKKQFSNISSSVDSSGFDMDGVGTPRGINGGIDHEINHGDNDKIEPVIGDLKINKIAESKNESAIPNEPENKVNVKAGVDLKVYSLIIQASESNPFRGRDFMPLFLSQGLKYGEMNIFHRYKNVGKDPGETLFSIANAVEPGTFDLSNIDLFTTPAFAIFSKYNAGQIDSNAAEFMSHYEKMVKTAEFIVKELGGKLLDESKNDYTQKIHKERLEEIFLLVS